MDFRENVSSTNIIDRKTVDDKVLYLRRIERLLWMPADLCRHLVEQYEKRSDSMIPEVSTEAHLSDFDITDNRGVQLTAKPGTSHIPKHGGRSDDPKDIVAAERSRRTRIVLDPSLIPDLEILPRTNRGELVIAPRQGYNPKSAPSPKISSGPSHKSADGPKSVPSPKSGSGSKEESSPKSALATKADSTPKSTFGTKGDSGPKSVFETKGDSTPKSAFYSKVDSRPKSSSGSKRDPIPKSGLDQRSGPSSKLGSGQDSAPSPETGPGQKSVQSPKSASGQKSGPSTKTASVQKSVPTAESASGWKTIQSSKTASAQKSVPTPESGSGQKTAPSTKTASGQKSPPSPESVSGQKTAQSAKTPSVQKSVPCPESASAQKSAPSAKTGSVQRSIPYPESASAQRSAPSAKTPSGHYSVPSPESASAPSAKTPSAQYSVPDPESASGQRSAQSAKTPSVQKTVPCPESTSAQKSAPSAKTGSVQRSIPCPESASAQRSAPSAKTPSGHYSVPCPESASAQRSIPCTESTSAQKSAPSAKTPSAQYSVPGPESASAHRSAPSAKTPSVQKSVPCPESASVQKSAPSAKMPSAQYSVPGPESASAQRSAPSAKTPSAQYSVPYPESASAQRSAPSAKTPSAQKSVPYPESTSAQKSAPSAKTGSVQRSVPCPESASAQKSAPSAKTPSVQKSVPCPESTSAQKSSPSARTPSGQKSVPYPESISAQKSASAQKSVPSAKTPSGQKSVPSPLGASEQKPASNYRTGSEPRDVEEHEIILTFKSSEHTLSLAPNLDQSSISGPSSKTPKYSEVVKSGPSYRSDQLSKETEIALTTGPRRIRGPGRFQGPRSSPSPRRTATIETIVCPETDPIPKKPNVPELVISPNQIIGAEIFLAPKPLSSSKKNIGGEILLDRKSSTTAIKLPPGSDIDLSSDGGPYGSLMRKSGLSLASTPSFRPKRGFQKLYTIPSSSIIIAKRGESPTIQYLVQLRSYNWLPANFFEEEDIDEYLRNNKIDEDESSNSSSDPDYEPNLKALESMLSYQLDKTPEVDLISRKIVDKRVVNNKTQYMLKSERLMWMDHYLCDQFGINRYESSHYKLVNVEAIDFTIPNILEKFADQMLLMDIDTSLENVDSKKYGMEEIYLVADCQPTSEKRERCIASHAKYLRRRINESVVITRIIQKRITEGKIQYLQVIRTYSWLAQPFFEEAVIGDYEKSSSSAELLRLASQKSDVIATRIIESERDGILERVVGRRVVENQVQYLLRTQKAIWLPSTYWTMEEIEKTEKHFASHSSSMTLGYETERCQDNFGTEERPAGHLNLQSTEFQAQIMVDASTMLDESELIKSEVNKAIIVKKITKRRIVNDIVEYQLEVRSYMWFPECCLEKQLIDDFVNGSYNISLGDPRHGTTRLEGAKSSDTLNQISELPMDSSDHSLGDQPEMESK